MKVILFGCPGAGKGTHAQLISEQYHIAKISASVVLREAYEQGELDLASKQAMERGEFVADELIISLIKKRITCPDCKNGYIFDGFPRTIPQAQALIDAGIAIDYVIEIHVTDQEVVRRLSERRVHLPSGRSYHPEFNLPKVPGRDDVTGEKLVHREDDKVATVRKRLKLYHQRTEPLRRFYHKLATKHAITKFVCVAGKGSVAEVRDRLFAVL